MKNIGIVGCGWLGKRIASALKNKGYHIVVSNSSENARKKMIESGFNSYLLDFSSREEMNFDTKYAIEKKVFEKCDIIMISIPVTSQESLSELRLKFQNIINFLNSEIPKQIFFFNSTGIYPNINAKIDEEFSNTKMLSQNFYAIEQLLSKSFPQINILRLAGFFGDDRIFSKYFSNRVLESGSQPVNHIQYSDIVSIIGLMIDHKMEHKLYNLVAPIHATKKEIIEVQVNKYNLKPPSEIRDELQDYKIVSSDKLIRELSYKFIFPDPKFF